MMTWNAPVPPSGRHRGNYPGEAAERRAIEHERVRRERAARHGLKPRLYATAAAPKRCGLWSRALERMVVPKHRRPLRVAVS